MQPAPTGMLCDYSLVAGAPPWRRGISSYACLTCSLLWDTSLTELLVLAVMLPYAFAWLQTTIGMP